MSFLEVVERAEAALGVLPESARADAEAVLAICRELEPGVQGAEREPAQVDVWRRELGRLVELLGRRSSQAIPYAALGRAGLAELRGAGRDRDALLLEASQKLNLFGL